jgi:uncharacterized protein (TIGR00369 family)
MSGKDGAAPRLTREELIGRLEAEFPEASHAVGDYDIEEIWYGGCRVRRRHHGQSLRPGGTVSGPVMMALADFTMYLAVLSAIGWVPLAVTTNLTINFLKRPGARDLLAEARLMKLGKRLAVGEVGLRSDGDDALVAHVTSTYSIPEPNT